MGERHTNGPMVVNKLWRRRLWVLAHERGEGGEYLEGSLDTARCTGVDATSTTSSWRTPEWYLQRVRLLQTGKISAYCRHT